MAKFPSGLAAKTGKSLGNKAQQCQSGPISVMLYKVWLEFACPNGDLTITSK